MRKIKNPWLDKEGYNCIGCAPNNPMGFHLDFFEEGDYILTRWKPTPNHAGWVNTLHGGVQALLLDEVAGWVVTRKLQTSGVTSKMELKYLKPVSTLENEITIRARISRQMRNVAFIEAEILNSQGELCTQSTLTYFCASKEKAYETLGFQGCELENP